MKIVHQTAVFIATGAYLGYMPVAPGTFGSLPGLLIFFLIAECSPVLFIVWTFCLIGMAVLTAHLVEKKMQRKDPGCIVIDEIAGMVVTLAFLPFTYKTAVIGFLAFRFFDVLKPYPIHILDKKIPGGLGIVADDILAGIYGCISLHILFLIISPY